MRTSGFRKIADDRIDVLDVVHHGSVRVAQAVVDGRAVWIPLRERDPLRRIAPMLAVDLAQSRDQPNLVSGFRRFAGQTRIDEVVEARQLAQTVLTTEFVELRYAMYAVPDDVERGDIDLFRGTLQALDPQVLQESWMILQGQQPEPLASHAQRPVRETTLPHERRGLPAECFDDGDLVGDRVRRGDLAVFDEMRKHRMQAVDADELFGKIERRPEMVRAAVDVIWITQRPVAL